ncbi:MAG: helicase HerA-like domain-containing protein, partial [Saprospiraceae bacterium]
MNDKFSSRIQSEYGFQSDSIELGCGMLDKVIIKETIVRLPLKTLNRHGLIAGATGTGKTKSLQLIAEQLSHKGIPCVLLDIKGDLSGIAAEGS